MFDRPNKHDALLASLCCAPLCCTRHTIDGICRQFLFFAPSRLNSDCNIMAICYAYVLSDE